MDRQNQQRNPGRPGESNEVVSGTQRIPPQQQRALGAQSVSFRGRLYCQETYYNLCIRIRETTTFVARAFRSKP